ncbi:GIY-YIG nuclease family protein [Pseudoalteromonas nigrifaciens]|uniref:GIY-YIG nuclease family protein n=1 Tax=Pseudoalteromonas nigrifaciens TaxID=28109 RepID=UPI003FD3FCE7
MKLLEKDFLGPLSLEVNGLPDVSAVYVILSKVNVGFEPLYIGIASRLKHRIKHQMFNGLLAENIENISDLSIFYWEFTPEIREEAEDLELKLIKKYKPSCNKAIYNSSKFNVKIEEFKKEEELRSKQWFRSSIIASMSLIITISAVFTFYMEGKKEAELKSVLEKELSTVFVKLVVAITTLCTLSLDTILFRV